MEKISLVSIVVVVLLMAVAINFIQSENEGRLWIKIFDAELEIENY